MLFVLSGRVFSLPRRHSEWGVQGKYLVTKASALFVNITKSSSRFDGVGGFSSCNGLPANIAFLVR